MTWVSNVLGHAQRSLAKVAGLLVLIALLFSTSCSKPQAVTSSTTSTTRPALFPPRPMIKQVEPPGLIRELTPWLDAYEPQVQIRRPQAEQVFDDTTVSVVLRSQDWLTRNATPPRHARAPIRPGHKDPSGLFGWCERSR